MNYDNSLIFQQAHARRLKTQEPFKLALRAVWDYHKKKNAAKIECEKMAQEWEKLNAAKDLKIYAIHKANVDSIAASLKVAYNELIAAQKPTAYTTASIIASVVNRKSETPSYKQMWAIVCGCWENGITLNYKIK